MMKKNVVSRLLCAGLSASMMLSMGAVAFADDDWTIDVEAMKEEAARVPKTGKTADIIRAQCQCYFNFFDRVIGEGAHEEMFQGKISLNACLDAADELLKFENDEATKLNGRYSEYTIQQHGNRQQRRNYNKQHGKKQNKGNVTYYRNGNR